MRILFMGTPDFAAESLNRLYADGYDICAVFSQPDKQQDRGMKIKMSPVKEIALLHNTPVFQPLTLRDQAAKSQIQQLQPDIIALVAYGKLLPPEILSIPQHGCVNIHGSILPRYRGAAPIQWAVLNGDKVTGVTAMYMAPEMDSGDIISTKTTEIGQYETSGELFSRLAVLGAALLSETISDISQGNIHRTKQKESEATYAPLLTKDMSPIDWTRKAREIICQIYGLNPWPMATAEINGLQFKIFKAIETDCQIGLAPGSVVRADQNGIEISCSDGSVIIKELQVSGGRRMSAADYLRGHPICQ